MMKDLKNEIEKMILGKDAEINIFSAVSKSKEDTMRVIGHSNEDHKEYVTSIYPMVEGLEAAINYIESQNN
jgi:hypothetical protein